MIFAHHIPTAECWPGGSTGLYPALCARSFGFRGAMGVVDCCERGGLRQSRRQQFSRLLDSAIWRILGGPTFADLAWFRPTLHLSRASSRYFRQRQTRRGRRCPKQNVEQHFGQHISSCIISAVVGLQSPSTEHSKIRTS